MKNILRIKDLELNFKEIDNYFWGVKTMVLERIENYLSKRHNCYGEKELLTLLEKKKLDDEFKKNEFYISVLKKIKGIFPEKYKEYMEILNKRNKEIIFFLKKYIEENQILGNQEVLKNYDILIILSCNNLKYQKIRVNAAIELLKKRKALVLVTGGGTYMDFTEAQMMERWVREKIDVSIIKEEDSLDTVSNAIFSRLVLRKKGLLKKGLKICIVTSEFHALRSYRIFERVFWDKKICVLGADTISDSDIEKNFEWIVHELSSENMSDNFFKIIGSKLDDEIKEDSDFLLNLLLRHKLYENRYDLLRKFSWVVKK